jgi:hypothetical protein
MVAWVSGGEGNAVPWGPRRDEQSAATKRQRRRRGSGDEEADEGKVLGPRHQSRRPVGECAGLMEFKIQQVACVVLILS